MLLLVVQILGKVKPNQPVFGKLFNVCLSEIKTNLTEIFFPVRKGTTKFSVRNRKVSNERRAAHGQRVRTVHKTFIKLKLHTLAPEEIGVRSASVCHQCPADRVQDDPLRFQRRCHVDNCHVPLGLGISRIERLFIKWGKIMAHTLRVKRNRAK